jgi:hypothetical protein
MIAGKGEATADKKEITAAITGGDATIPRGRKILSASIGVKVMSLARRKGRPLGNRKQPPVFRRTASRTPSTDSQHCPETTA